MPWHPNQLGYIPCVCSVYSVTSAHMYTYKHTFIQTHIHTNTHSRMSIQTHIHVFYIHTQTHKHAHTRITTSTPPHTLSTAAMRLPHPHCPAHTAGHRGVCGTEGNISQVRLHELCTHTQKSPIMGQKRPLKRLWRSGMLKKGLFACASTTNTSPVKEPYVTSNVTHERALCYLKRHS